MSQNYLLQMNETNNSFTRKSQEIPITTEKGEVFQNQNVGTSSSGELKSGSGMTKEKMEVAIKELPAELQEYVRGEIDKDRIKQTEILGVFVALFTFVSVNFQLFSNISNLGVAIFFMLVSFFCLSGFVLLMNFLLGKEVVRPKLIVPQPWLTILYILFILLMLFGIFICPKIELQTKYNNDVQMLENRIELLEKNI